MHPYWKRVVVSSFALLLTGVSAPAFAASQIVAGWRIDNVPATGSESVRFLDKEKNVVITVSRAKLIGLVDTLSRIQKSAGTTTDFYIIHYLDNRVNAFATRKDGRNIVGITPAMLDLIGDDMDAYAAIFGHELAHINKGHGADRAARTGFLQGLGLIAGIVIGAKTGINPGSLLNLGTDVVNKTFTRDEEREADKLGLDYMVASGFNPQGAIRAHERMMGARKYTPIPFFSTHPSGEERISNFRQIIASIPEAERATPKPQAGDTAILPPTPAPLARPTPTLTPTPGFSDVAKSQNEEDADIDPHRWGVRAWAHAGPNCRRVHQRFLAATNPRAYAISPDGACGYAVGGTDPQERALELCQLKSKQSCQLYAVDNAFVWQSHSSTLNEEPRTIQLAQERVVAEPLNPLAWRALAQQYESRGEDDKAVRAYQEALRLEPSSADTLEALGILYARSGERTQLRAVWESLGKIDKVRAETLFSTFILP